MKATMIAAACALLLAACGGGDAPQEAPQECRTVTNTSGGFLDNTGAVIIPASTIVKTLCCTKGFTTFSSGEVVNPDGSVMRASENTVCTT